jgi:hypothetical protein
MFKERPTIDVVVILMTILVGVVLIMSTLGILVVRIMTPEADVSGGAAAVGNILTTVVGALVGLIGGRAAGRMEANGLKSALTQTEEKQP